MPMMLEFVPSLLGAAGRYPEPVLPLWVMELLAKTFGGVWLFCFGACVGSFLNVVVYRLPRGMSLAHPGSHCPSCGHAIRGRDNIPLLSWLLLGGKCRDCHEPISPRYYYVELVLALTFLHVAAFEAYLPRGPELAAAVGEQSRQLLTTRQPLPFWSAYATHVVLLATLAGAALIDFDGFRTPRRMFVPVILLALILGAIWPDIRPVPAIRDYRGAAWQVGLVDGAAGAAAGLALGTLAGLAWRIGSRGQPWPRLAPVMLLAAIGVVLGWQQMIVLAPLAVTGFAALLLLMHFASSASVVPLAGIAAALAGWMVVQWDTILWPLQAAATNFPAAACALSALATIAAALTSDAVASREYHAAAKVPTSAGIAGRDDHSPAAVDAAEPVLTSKPIGPHPQ